MGDCVSHTASLEFCNSILPRIKPLFLIKDPPQNQSTPGALTPVLLLNQTDLFVSKMTPSQFREGASMPNTDVMPLFYASFENEHIAVQENALQKVPQLCELLEFSHVKDTLLPKLMALFSKTKTLSVKVSALVRY